MQRALTLGSDVHILNVLHSLGQWLQAHAQLPWSKPFTEKNVCDVADTKTKTSTHYSMPKTMIHSLIDMPRSETNNVNQCLINNLNPLYNLKNQCKVSSTWTPGPLPPPVYKTINYQLLVSSRNMKKKYMTQ